MGYSARYHAASLAAVFLALAVGILIGVGFGSDLVTGTAEDLEQSLSADLDAARDEIGELEQQVERDREYAELTYPELAGGRLGGEEVALVALGGLSDPLVADVRAALRPSGAELNEVAVVREPPDSAAMAEALRRPGDRHLPRGEALEVASRRAGQQLVEGGPRFEAARDAMLSRYSGSARGVDAVIVVRERPEGISPREEEDTERLEDQLLAGIEASGRPLVGAERSDAEDSSVEFFADRGAATVDSVDLPSGRLALVLALDGAEGNFGVKETADSLLPLPISPGSGVGSP